MSEREHSTSLELWPLERLRPYERNARRHKPDKVRQLSKSIRRFGFTAPILVTEEGEILAGHARLLAAIEAGVERVPVRILRGFSATEAQAYVLADNQFTLAASWDEELLAGELLTLRDAEFDLDALGFSPAELQKLLGPAPAEDDAEIEIPVPAEPRTKVGDLWRLGAHLVLCGDTFQEADVRRLLDGSKADAVLTDPPFAIYGSASGISSNVADDKMVRPFFGQLGRTIRRSTRPFGHVYVHCDWRSYATVFEGFKSAGLTPTNCIVWDKGDQGLGSMWANAHEFVAFFTNKPTQHTMRADELTGQRTVYRPNILRVNRTSGEERQHNAAKPLALLGAIVQAATDPDQLVLDLFGGSGSTLIACEKAGRRCRMMEMEPTLCDLIVARWEQTTGKEAVLA